MASEASKALRLQEAAAHGPVSAAEVATAKKGQGDARKNKIVIAEMDEFVLGLQPNGETRKREAQDVFTDEDVDASCSGTLAKDDMKGSALVQEEAGIEGQAKEGAVKQDAVLHEVAVGKGLAGALKFLQERGTLNEGEGGTNDKKKSKAAGFKDGPKEIRIERIDEFGRVMTQKEAFRELSHKFHGKCSGKKKQEKRQRKYQDELKAKRMKPSDTPLLSAEKMREAQARNKTPYLVLSGGAKSR